MLVEINFLVPPLAALRVQEPAAAHVRRVPAAPAAAAAPRLQRHPDRRGSEGADAAAPPQSRRQ